MTATPVFYDLREVVAQEVFDKESVLREELLPGRGSSKDNTRVPM